MSERFTFYSMLIGCLVGGGALALTIWFIAVGV